MSYQCATGCDQILDQNQMYRGSTPTISFKHSFIQTETSKCCRESDELQVDVGEPCLIQSNQKDSKDNVNIISLQ